MGAMNREERHDTIVKSKPDKCPRCGSPRIARIFYGLPAMSPELRKKLDEGTVVLGGCMPMAVSWRCLECREGFIPENHPFRVRSGKEPLA